MLQSEFHLHKKRDMIRGDTWMREPGHFTFFDPLLVEGTQETHDGHVLFRVKHVVDVTFEVEPKFIFN